MDRILCELSIVTENLSAPVIPQYLKTCKVRKCVGGCARWIRFCTAEYTICGSCWDTMDRYQRDVEDHRYVMEMVMEELTSKIQKYDP